MTPSVLSVDDDPLILQGFRRALHHRRREWKLHFAERAEQALEQLNRETPDIVISDMRMPGRDGASLLQEVQANHPGVVRIVLSGDARIDAIKRAVAPSHQYLSKPCASGVIESAIERSLTVRDLVADQELAALVSSLANVPSLPKAYKMIQDELAKPDTDIKRVGEIIESDAGMTAGILKITNSAYFGLPRIVSDISQAVSYLGLDTISSLVLSHGVFSSFEGNPALAAALTELQHQTDQAVTYARSLNTILKVDKSVADDVLLAVMMGNLGSIIAAARSPYTFTTTQTPDTIAEVLELEEKVVGCHFDRLGAYLLGLWSLPYPVVEAVAFRKTPSAGTLHDAKVLTVAHLAFAFALGTDSRTVAAAEQWVDSEYMADALPDVEWQTLWQACLEDMELAS
ncbi:MAG: HDOD domain-containing protein [Pseudomonadota bacterium]